MEVLISVVNWAVLDHGIVLANEVGPAIIIRDDLEKGGYNSLASFVCRPTDSCTRHRSNDSRSYSLKEPSETFSAL